MSEKKMNDVEKDEIVNEEELLNDDASTENDEILALKQRIEELEVSNKELDNKYYMAYADAQNISKRAKIDAENMLFNKISRLVGDILPVLDNFERALSSKVENEDTINFVKGFEMIYTQLKQALENEGVKVIECIGLEFDPNYHQSIGSVTDENYASNIVVEELQKGYVFRDKVIRPSLVKINE